MDKVLSFAISVGIIAFGIWIIAGDLKTGAPLTWYLIGLLPVLVGSVSLYEAARDA